MCVSTLRLSPFHPPVLTRTVCILAVNHRKALSPSTAFPAQLLDLTAGYAYLLSRGFSPENIVLIGDSSGGHLMLALSRYISELSRVEPKINVGMPGAMILISVCVILISFRVWLIYGLIPCTAKL